MDQSRGSPPLHQGIQVGQQDVNPGVQGRLAGRRRFDNPGCFNRPGRPRINHRPPRLSHAGVQSQQDSAPLLLRHYQETADATVPGPIARSTGIPGSDTPARPTGPSCSNFSRSHAGDCLEGAGAGERHPLVSGARLLGMGLPGVGLPDAGFPGKFPTEGCGLPRRANRYKFV